MATHYTYTNGVYQVTTYIYNGFKRFHSMNAQHRRFVTYDNNMHSRFIVWQFISYDTKLVQVVFDCKYVKWQIIYNDNPFDYSPSTTRQISRWIKEKFTFFTPNDIKLAYEKCNSITPDVSTYQFNDMCVIDFVSHNKMNDVWRW